MMRLLVYSYGNVTFLTIRTSRFVCLDAVSRKFAILYIIMFAVKSRVLLYNC